MNCVFVGNVNEQKGAKYLLQAYEKLVDKDVSLEFIGAYSRESIIYQKYSSICKFTGHIIKEKLIEKLQGMDVIIFPSLADGFGFAVVEAMACGVVPIVSKNAGVSCLIDDGINGYIVDPMSSEQIYDKIICLKDNMNVLKMMRKNAIYTARKLTWNNYYNDVQNAMSIIINE